MFGKEWGFDFENRCSVKLTKIFQLHLLAKIVRYSALSTCVHARVPGIPELGLYTDRASRSWDLNLAEHIQL